MYNGTNCIVCPVVPFVEAETGTACEHPSDDIDCTDGIDCIVGIDVIGAIDVIDVGTVFC